jgi:hypothetical protein
MDNDTLFIIAMVLSAILGAVITAPFCAIYYRRPPRLVSRLLDFRLQTPDFFSRKAPAHPDLVGLVGMPGAGTKAAAMGALRLGDRSAPGSRGGFRFISMPIYRHAGKPATKGGQPKRRLS